jgi:dienelactone hydrolase
MKERSQNSPNKIRWWLLATFVVVILGTLFWGIRWATFARPPLPEAIEALESDDQVNVTQDPWLTFSQISDPSKTGFIFYPGGRVDPKGYASLMREIASEGYLVVVPEMPINMAVFNPNIADEITANYPEIQNWAIGGHSLGGTMAAQYTDKHPEIIDGLAIWASYPANNTDISDLDIPVVSIYGSRELRVNDASIGERKHLLPEDALYIRIEGGDHHQFGSYEINPGDHLATTSRASQQKQTIQATLKILREISQHE